LCEKDDASSEKVRRQNQKTIPLNLIAGEEGSPPLFQSLGVERTAAFSIPETLLLKKPLVLVRRAAFKQ
jgi:hypothetical protein